MDQYTFSKDFTLDDAIKILREHNATGIAVVHLTGGELYERPLMLSFLDEVERVIAENTKLKKLLSETTEELDRLYPLVEYGRKLADEVLKLRDVVNQIYTKVVGGTENDN